MYGYVRPLTPDEIYHHGILGQKWGKRNGPPYPLGASDHSASERKAGWKKSLDGKNKEVYNNNKHTGKKGSSNRSSENDVEHHRKALLQDYKGDSEKTEYYKNATPEQIKADLQRRETFKKVAIGAVAVAGVSAGVYLAYKHMSVNDMYNIIKDGSELTKDSAEQILRSNIKDVEVILKKGDVLHRMEAKSAVDYSNKTGIFTAFREDDVAAYMTLLRDFKGTGERYDVTMEALKDIRVPTKAKAEEIFNQVWKNDKEYSRQLYNTILNTYGGDKYAAAKALRQDPFYHAVFSFGKHKQDADMLGKIYKKHGYDGIMDYHDIVDGFTKKPLILFDSSSISIKGEQKVDKLLKKKTLFKAISKGYTEVGGYDIGQLIMAINAGLI